jgi:quinolinate synthase
MVEYDELLAYKQTHPDTVIVTYVNSHADNKALSDVIVTSSNAEKIVKNYSSKHIMYVPDKNLGLYLKDKLGFNIDVWPGFCYIHEMLTIKDVEKLRLEHPNAKLLIHPEAPLEVLRLADFVGSTKQILDYATNDSSSEFIIGTDKGIIHALEKRNPNKNFYLLSKGLNCGNMKKITLEDVYIALKDEIYEVEVEKDIRDKAVIALDKMMELS